MMTVATKIAF